MNINQNNKQKDKQKKQPAAKKNKKTKKDEVNMFKKHPDEQVKTTDQHIERESFINKSNYSYLEDMDDDERDKIFETSSSQEVHFSKGVQVTNPYAKMYDEEDSETNRLLIKLRKNWFDFMHVHTDKALVIYYLISFITAIITFILAIPLFGVAIAFAYMTRVQENTKRYNSEIDNRKYVKNVKKAHVILAPLLVYNAVFAMRLVVPYMQDYNRLFFFLLIVSVATAASYNFKKQIGITYMKNLEEKYYYDMLAENWTPETSIFERDAKELKNHHPRIGVRVDTGEPVYLRYDDLFTHTLNMGGTGSGKTAIAMFPIFAHMITVPKCGVIAIDPKGDFAIEAYCLALAKKAAGELPEGREVHLFDPRDPNCPYFNPLGGSLEDAIEMLSDLISKLNGGGSSGGNAFFENKEKSLIEQATRIVKYTDSAGATIADVHYLISNKNLADKMLQRCQQKVNMLEDGSDFKLRLEGDISYFANEYWEVDARGQKSKEYEHSQGTRDKMKKFVSSKYLNNIFNVKGRKTIGRTELNFADFVANKKILCISTGQGTLSDDEGYALAFAIIIRLQSYYLGVPPKDRVDSMLFIDEYQVFANRKMENLFTQGRGYRVAMHVATQSLGNLDKSDMRDVVTSNTFVKILFPSLTGDDVQFFKRLLGEKDGYSESHSGKKNLVTGKESDDVGLKVEKKATNTFRTSQFNYEKAKHFTVAMRSGIQQMYPILVQGEFVDGHIKPIVSKKRREFEDKHNAFINESIKRESARTISVNPISSLEFKEFLLSHENLDGTLSQAVEAKDNQNRLNQQYNQGDFD